MTKLNPNRRRAPNKILGTPALVALYEKIVRPFLNRYTLHEEQRELKEGIEAFFSVKKRPIKWCKARSSFTMPGSLWASPSRPHILVEGTGRRYVKTGEGVVVRQEDGRADYHEVEFDEQVFVLTDAQFSVIEEKLEPRA